jgi:hypothetical protein
MLRQMSWKRKGCGTHLRTIEELLRAALRFARVPQKRRRDFTRPGNPVNATSRSLATRAFLGNSGSPYLAARISSAAAGASAITARAVAAAEIHWS